MFYQNMSEYYIHYINLY